MRDGHDRWLALGDPADEPVAAACYLPKCPRPATWHIEPVEPGPGGRDACGGHLAKAVERASRKAKGGTVAVHPLFDVENVAQLVELVMIGAAIYGLVTDPTAALAIEAMTAETLDIMRRALGDDATVRHLPRRVDE